ncbi:SGNH/GDSL hydrolase family protein [Bradyrhizobium genosp. A]|uniref:SGNH/GDSL hydrolase family protein n=1 Tax=Bradyrhizobium genosp. A TaxID=83626 RepID=UPI003CEAB460
MLHSRQLSSEENAEFSWRALALTLVLAVIAVEAGATMICRSLAAYPQANRFLWDPKLEQVRANWNSGSSMLDPDIGGLLTPEDIAGNAEPCGSAYGDSFTSGFESEDGEGWVERLSHILGCRVANYSVGGYGIDQAYRRLEKTLDGSRFVLLGLDPNGIMDVVSQYDGWLGGDQVPFALKGRFVITPSGTLNWIGLPRLDADRFVALNQAPSDALPASYFLPGTSDGAVISRFPYTLTLARVALMPSVRAFFSGHTEWNALYQADHPSGALQLMVAISEAFATLAGARGQRPLIVILPVAGSFRENTNFGHFEYADLVDELRARHIKVLDVGPVMATANSGRSACGYFTRQDSGFAAWLRSPMPCGGHYSSRAHAIVAQLVKAELKRQGMLEH